MKKICSAIFNIAIILLAFSLLTMLFMPKYVDKNVDGRITAEFYREKDNIDVIFIGSSTVQADISPMVLYQEGNIKAYNRSNSSQVIPLSYYMAKDAIKRKKPKLIICDVGFIYQSDDYIDEGASRKSLDSMRWSVDKYNAIKAMLGSEEHFIDYVFPILRFHSRWNDLSIEDIKYLLYKPTVTYNGQLLDFRTIEENRIYDPYSLDETIIASDRNMKYLEDLSKLCRENNIELALIKLPMVNGNWNRNLDEQIQIFADSNDISYKSFIDDFDSIGLDMYSDFHDVQHMNSYGAEKFTKVLYKYIVDNYELSIDGGTKTFDKKLERYKNAFNNKIPSERVDDGI